MWHFTCVQKSWKSMPWRDAQKEKGKIDHCDTTDSSLWKEQNKIQIYNLWYTEENLHGINLCDGEMCAKMKKEQCKDATVYAGI